MYMCVCHIGGHGAGVRDKSVREQPRERHAPPLAGLSHESPTRPDANRHPPPPTASSATQPHHRHPPPPTASSACRTASSSSSCGGRGGVTLAIAPTERGAQDIKRRGAHMECAGGTNCTGTSNSRGPTRTPPVSSATCPTIKLQVGRPASAAALTPAATSCRPPPPLPRTPSPAPPQQPPPPYHYCAWLQGHSSLQ